VVSPYLRAVKAASGATAALQLAGGPLASAATAAKQQSAAVVSHVRQGDET